MDEMHLINEACQDEAAEAAQDIEAFAREAIDFAERAIDEGMVAPAYVPEALLLAAVELAAMHDGNPEHLAGWLERVAARLREHVVPKAGPAS